MNTETVRQIIADDLGMRNISTKMVPRILTDDQKRGLHISSDLLHNAGMFDRVTTADETWCFQYDQETKMPEHAVENTEFTSAKKSTHVLLAVKDYACVFLQSQGDTSL
jgi:hypothetical protein